MNNRVSRLSDDFRDEAGDLTTRLYICAHLETKFAENKDTPV